MRNIVYAAVAAVSLAGPALANPIVTDYYTSFYSFGDSLSDDGGPGKFPDFILPYVEGRASNGQVWAENIEDKFIAAGRESANLALSGATAGGADGGEPLIINRLGTFAGQVGHFVDTIAAGENPGNNPLVTVWLGGNDLLATIGTPTAVDAAIQAADDVKDGILAIAAIAGQNFNDFVVPNLFDLAKAPLYAPLPQFVKDSASAATQAYNSRLAANIAMLEAGGLNIIDIDVETLVNEVQANPLAFGFTDATGACVDLTNGINCAPLDPADADGFLFLDGVHPTRTAHKVLSDHIHERIAYDVSQVPVPATLPLMVVVVGGLAFAGRRRRG